MAFCEINGVHVDVKDGSWKETPTFVTGSSGRAQGGQMRGTDTKKKRTWKGTTSILKPSEAVFLETLFSRRGYSWSFDDDVYGRKGLGPNSAAGYTRTNSGGQYGGKVTVSSGNSITFETGFSGSWTLVHWKGGTHYILTSDGDEYEDGNAGTHNISNWTTVASGDFSLEGKDAAGSNADADYDEVYVVPAVITATQAPQWHTRHDAIQLAHLPFVTLSGDCVRDTSVAVWPTLDDVDYVQCHIGGTWYDNARVLSFTLSEE